LILILKENHEKWIRTVLELAKNNDYNNSLVYLPRLETGKQIIDIIKRAHEINFDHDDLKSEDETKLISEFLQYLQDWMEMSDLKADFEISGQINLSYELNEKIANLEKSGFLIFGERTTVQILESEDPAYSLEHVATIYVIRKENSDIFCSKKLAALNHIFPQNQ
jgi:hypothetical protein